MPGLISELKRRNVFRVGIAYLALAWLVIQVTAIAIPALNLPESLNSIVFFIGLIGFPFALFFAWAFELTPDGVRREGETEAETSSRQSTRQQLNHLTIVLLSLALIFVIVDQYFLEEKTAPETTASAEPAELQPAAEDAPESRIRSIAVLPFRSRSAVADDAHFVDGMHDDILTLLTRISAFDRVISRTSVERYRDTTQSIGEIAAELDVTTILEGGVQRAGNRIRINLQLIEAATDKHLWADTYDREMTVENVFAIQSDVTKAVIDALEATLTPAESEQIAPAPPANLAAMEQFFMARQKSRRASEGDWPEANEHFKRAVELDPDFALGWAYLGIRYMQMGFQNREEREKNLGLSFEAVERALALNPRLGEAYLALGNLHFMLDALDAADEAFVRAAELIPNSADLYYSLGNLRYTQGRLEEAVNYHQQAQQRGGLDYAGSAGSALLTLGRPDEARHQFELAVEHNPESPLGYLGVAASYWMQGELSKAVIWTRRGQQRNLTLLLNPHLHLANTMIFWDIVDDEEGFCVAQWLYNRDPGGYGETELMMLAWLVAGDRERALEFAHMSKDLMMSHAMVVGIRPYTLALLRDEALAAGKTGEIRELYRSMFPLLFESRTAPINLATLSAVIDLLPVLRATGDGDWANELAMRALEFISSNQTIGSVFAADVFVFLGQYDRAIEALREFAAVGGLYWRIGIEFNSNLAPLREREDYNEIISSLRARGLAQRALLRQTETTSDTCRSSG